MGTIVVVEALVKKYGQFTAVNHMNLEVKEGSIYGFLGPNGAGKSTTLSIIATLLRMNEGHVTIDGLDLEKQKSKIRQLIGWVPQEIVLYPRMSIRENIRFYGSLYGLHGAKLEQACEEALKVVSLDQDTGRKVMGLSGGMQRRLNIACGIVHHPKLIIMDEPTVGVDAQSRDLIMDSIKSLNQAGSSIIYTSHYMHEVEELCDEIGIVNKGQMIARGTYEELATEYADGNCFCVDTSKEALQFHMQEIMGKYVDLHVSVDENTLKFLVQGENHINRILQDMISMNMPVYRLTSEQMSLEDIFLRLTGKQTAQ